MGHLVKLIAVSTHPSLDTHLGLVPLITGLSVILILLLAVVGYGVRRVKLSEGLVAPARVEQPYVGPALTWTSTIEPSRKLVVHDALGLGYDLSWLNNRDVPASLSPHPPSSQPIVALEFAAKVFATSLPAAPLVPASIIAELEDKARREKIAARAAQSLKLDTLRNSVSATSSRSVAAAAVGSRPRTAVLRAADPLPPTSGAPVSKAGSQSARGEGATPRSSAVPQAASARTNSTVSTVSPGATAVRAVKAATPASTNSTKISSPSQASTLQEGHVTDYSFTDFL